MSQTLTLPITSATLGVDASQLHVTNAFMPDYANIENINRITANNGTWTADRDGFVQLHYTGAATDPNGCAHVYFLINDVIVDYNTFFGVAIYFGEGKKGIYPVKAGDVVKISMTPITRWGRDQAYSCYYIPPRA